MAAFRSHDDTPLQQPGLVPAPYGQGQHKRSRRLQARRTPGGARPQSLRARATHPHRALSSVGEQLCQHMRAVVACGGSYGVRLARDADLVSCGVRAHAQLPAVDLKSTPLTTRANCRYWTREGKVC